MVDKLLTRLLRFALGETRVERIYAFDKNNMLVDYAALDAASLNPPQISDFMLGLVQRANQTGQLILSNNTFIDPSQAPNTNTNIQNLRIYVVIPVNTHGALFLDQPIGKGIVPRPTIDKLAALCEKVTEDNTLTDEQMRELFTT